MSDKIHDRTFKLLMSQASFFIDFCRAYMPEEIFKAADWQTLEAISFESAYHHRVAKQAYIADIVYAVLIGARRHLILVHAEHFSYDDPLWQLRVTNYQTGMLLKYADVNKTKRLPPVITFVYRQGRRPFRGPHDMFASFTDPELAKRYFANPILIDLPSVPDDILLAHRGIASAEMVFKYIFGDLRPFYETIAVEMGRCDGKICEILIEYIIERSDTGVDEFIEMFLSRLPHGEDILMGMTIAQQLEKRGEARGEARGKAEALTAVACNMLRCGVDEAIITESTGFSAAELTKLKNQMLH